MEVGAKQVTGSQTVKELERGAQGVLLPASRNDPMVKMGIQTRTLAGKS